MVKNLLIGLAVAILTTGCITPAKRLDREPVDKIVVNQTTRGEVEAQFGRPAHLVTGSEGRTLAQYRYSRGSSYGEPAQLRLLSLLYNRNFVVERKLLSEGTLNLHIKLFGPTRAGEALDRAAVIRFLTPGRTRDEMVREFGPPTFEELNVRGEIILTWLALQDGVLFFKRMEGQALVVRLDENGMLLDYSISGTLEPEKQDPPRPSTASEPPAKH